MAVVALYKTMSRNNNSANTNIFRAYIRDMRATIIENCTELSVQGSKSTRYRNNSHALWIELGIDVKYCMIMDYINDIDGDTDLNLITTVYIPETSYLNSLARRINR